MRRSLRGAAAPMSSSTWASAWSASASSSPSSGSGTRGSRLWSSNSSAPALLDAECSLPCWGFYSALCLPAFRGCSVDRLAFWWKFNRHLFCSSGCCSRKKDDKEKLLDVTQTNMNLSLNRTMNSRIRTVKHPVTGDRRVPKLSSKPANNVRWGCDYIIVIVKHEHEMFNSVH